MKASLYVVEIMMADVLFVNAFFIRWMPHHR
jgi:hypothetical protein